MPYNKNNQFLTPTQLESLTKKTGVYRITEQGAEEYKDARKAEDAMTKIFRGFSLGDHAEQEIENYQIHNKHGNPTGDMNAVIGLIKLRDESLVRDINAEDELSETSVNTLNKVRLGNDTLLGYMEADGMVEVEHPLGDIYNYFQEVYQSIPGPGYGMRNQVLGMFLHHPEKEQAIKDIVTMVRNQSPTMTEDQHEYLTGIQENSIHISNFIKLTRDLTTILTTQQENRNNE